MKIGAIIKDALILFVVTLVLGAALSVTKVITQPAIDKTAEEAKIKAFNAVCSGYNSSEDITNKLSNVNAGDIARFTNDKEKVLLCKDKSNNNIGFIVLATSKGYGGNLNIIVGFDMDGNITGVKYANTPSETPGLGMRTTKEDFLSKWNGHNNDDINSVDTLSGATISSTAFKEAVKFACAYVDKAKTVVGGK